MKYILCQMEVNAMEKNKPGEGKGCRMEKLQF